MGIDGQGAALRGSALFLLLCSALASAQVGTSAGGVGASGGPGFSATEVLPAGSRIADVTVEVEGTESASAASELTARLREALAIRPGDSWDPALGAAALARVRQLPGVRAAALSGQADSSAEGYRLTLQVDAGASKLRPDQGLFAGDGFAAFPVLHRDDRDYVKVELAGGHGVFSDGNPWFGHPEVFTRNNPLVEDPTLGADTGDRATWTESSLQLGASGVASLNDNGLYGFGAITGVGVVSYGQDIFRGDSRSSFDLEKAYAGVLYAPTDRDLRLKVSVGRQNYSLNNGFLVSQFGSQWNAGPRPGVYLAPRTTQDMSLLATASTGEWKATFFALDPNELESLESDTVLLGTNLARATSGRWSWDVTALHVPTSESAYRAPDALPRSREGLWTAAGHLRMRTRPKVPDLWFEAELARQWHDDFDMEAWAGYAELGYFARGIAWSPSLSYRYASFSGDDPATAEYERFDTLYSGGLDHWLQGISINKALSQANRRSHRIRFNINPIRPLNLTFDVYRHIANELNNLGANPALGTLASDDLGDEIQLTARWQVSPRVLVLGIASAAFPGDAIDAAVEGAADNWTTLQLQAFWGF